MGRMGNPGVSWEKFWFSFYVYLLHSLLACVLGLWCLACGGGDGPPLSSRDPDLESQFLILHPSPLQAQASEPRQLSSEGMLFIGPL